MITYTQKLDKVQQHYQKKKELYDALARIISAECEKRRQVVSLISLINCLSSEKLYIDSQLSPVLKSKINLTFQQTNEFFAIEGKSPEELLEEIRKKQKCCEYFCSTPGRQELLEEYGKIFGAQDRKRMVKTILYTMACIIAFISLSIGFRILNEKVITPAKIEKAIATLTAEYSKGEYDNALITLNENSFNFDDYFDRAVIADSFSKRIDGGKNYAMSISGDGQTHIALDCDGYTWLVNIHEWAEGDAPIQVSTDGYKMAVLYKDGTVHCESGYGDEIDTSSWSSIKSITVGLDSVFAVTTSGTIKVTGQEEGKSWDKYSAVSEVLAGNSTIAIYFNDGECITMDGSDHLKDVTCPVIAGEMLWGINSNAELVGNHTYLIEDIHYWNNLSLISGTPDYLVGLKKDGTVIHHAFDGSSGIERSEEWSNIIAIATGERFLWA